MKLSSKIKSAIMRLKNAAIEDSYKGGGDPQDFEAIELRLKLAEAKVNELLAMVDLLEAGKTS